MLLVFSLLVRTEAQGQLPHLWYKRLREQPSVALLQPSVGEKECTEGRSVGKNEENGNPRLYGQQSIPHEQNFKP